MERKISNWDELKNALKEKYENDDRYTFKINPENDDIYIDIDVSINSHRFQLSLTICKDIMGLCESDWLIVTDRTEQQLYNIVTNLLEI